MSVEKYVSQIKADTKEFDYFTIFPCFGYSSTKNNVWLLKPQLTCHSTSTNMDGSSAYTKTYSAPARVRQV